MQREEVGISICRCNFPRRELKIILLFGCSCVLREMPLHVTVLILKCTATDLEYPHRHSGANLGKLNTIVACPYENVVSDFNAVVDIFKRHHPVTNLGLASNWLSGWEQVL